MKLRLVVGLAVCGLLGAVLLPAHAAENSMPGESMLGADLAGLLEYAREHNPELAAARFDADAAAQRAQAAAALPDPVLRAELMDITNRGMDRTPACFRRRWAARATRSCRACRGTANAI